MWNKSDIETQVSHDLRYTWNIKRSSSWKLRREQSYLHRLGSGRNGEMLVLVLNLVNSGGQCTTQWLSLITVSLTWNLLWADLICTCSTDTHLFERNRHFPMCSQTKSSHCTLNIYNFICQLYLNKTGRKKKDAIVLLQSEIKPPDRQCEN